MLNLYMICIILFSFRSTIESDVVKVDHCVSLSREKKVYFQLANGELGSIVVSKNSECPEFVNVEFRQSFLNKLVIVNTEWE